MNTNIVLLDGFEFQYRADDYINLTLMCKQSGKKVGNFFQNKQTVSFLEALSKRLNCNKKDLVKIVSGGIPNQQGTWGHPIVALHLAQWLSPEIYLDTIMGIVKYINKDLLEGYVSRDKKDSSGFIYLVNIKGTSFYKIGYSQDIIKRLSTLQTANALELIIKERFFSLDARALERSLHSYYQDKRIRGEWYQLSQDDTERFILIANNLDKEQEVNSLIEAQINKDLMPAL